MEIENFALIIGGMKCGTTSLFNYLSEHPEIAPCSYKEPAFFSKEINYSQGINFYQSLGHWNPQKHKVALEASTGYTRCTHPNFLNAAENIAQYKNQANFKFIYVVRDPLERLEAHYNHGLAYDFPECQNVTDTFINQEILDTSKYAMQLEHYYSLFPSENILLINFNDLKANPAIILKNICLFLNIDADYKFHSLDVVHNSNKERKKIDLPLWSLVKKNPLLISILEIIPKSYKTQVRDIIGKNANKDFKLSANQQKIVINELKEDLLKLKNEYNFNINDWKITKNF